MAGGAFEWFLRSLNGAVRFARQPFLLKNESLDSWIWFFRRDASFFTRDPPLFTRQPRKVRLSDCSSRQSFPTVRIKQEKTGFSVEIEIR